MEIGQILKWKVMQPNAAKSHKSPVFWFQDHEWYFELLLNFDSYEIFFRSKNEENDFPKSFAIDSYIEKGSERICFYSEIIVSKSTYIGQFNLQNVRKKINSTDVCKFVFIFHCDMGLTLQHCSQEKVSDAESGLSKFSQDISKILDEGGFRHDLEIKCGDQTFKVHKNILSTRSQVFCKMFQSDPLKVEIKDMNSDFFDLFLRYLSSGQLPELDSENAVALYEAGNKYQIEELRKHCEDFLMGTLTSARSCEMLILADAYADENFKGGLITYVKDQKIPLMDEIWQDFCDDQPELALEVINKLYKLQVSH